MIRTVNVERHYANAPITEAIIDLRVKPRIDLNVESLEAVHSGEEIAYPQEKLPQSLAVSDEENAGYRHVPLKTVGTIRVRYNAAVPLRPRQFVFDDEDK